jgi:polar amino acid transport system ATP-binding protein
VNTPRRSSPPLRSPEQRRGDPTSTELLRLDGVRKSFGDNVVLRDVDLTIEPGQCVVLIGASGSGKSTLLRCVNLLEVVDDGVITFEGRDITDPRVDGDEVRSHMGMVFQAYNLFPHLDVIGNVTLALRLVHGVGAEEARSRGLAMLERVGLAPKAQARPDDLSGGQLQRVAIARALVSRPALLVADEPVSMIDASLRASIVSLLRGLCVRTGVSIIYITHDLATAYSVSDRIMIMRLGKVVESGPARAVLDDPQHEYSRLLKSSVLSPEVPSNGAAFHA